MNCPLCLICDGNGANRTEINKTYTDYGPADALYDTPTETPGTCDPDCKCSDAAGTGLAKGNYTDQEGRERNFYGAQCNAAPCDGAAQAAGLCNIASLNGATLHNFAIQVPCNSHCCPVDMEVGDWFYPLDENMTLAKLMSDGSSPPTCWDRNNETTGEPYWASELGTYDGQGVPYDPSSDTYTEGGSTTCTYINASAFGINHYAAQKFGMRDGETHLYAESLLGSDSEHEDHVSGTNESEHNMTQFTSHYALHFAEKNSLRTQAEVDHWHDVHDIYHHQALPGHNDYLGCAVTTRAYDCAWVPYTTSTPFSTRTA